MRMHETQRALRGLLLTTTGLLLWFGCSPSSPEPPAATPVASSTDKADPAERATKRGGTGLSTGSVPRYLPAESVLVLSFDGLSQTLESVGWRDLKAAVDRRSPGLVDDALAAASRATAQPVRSPSDLARLGIDPKAKIGLVALGGGCVVGFVGVLDKGRVQAQARRLAGQWGHALQTRPVGEAAVIDWQAWPVRLILRDRQLFALWCADPDAAARWESSLAQGELRNALVRLPAFRKTNANVISHRGLSVWLRIDKLIDTALAEWTGAAALERAQLALRAAPINTPNREALEAVHRRLQQSLNGRIARNTRLELGVRRVLLGVEGLSLGGGLSAGRLRIDGRLEGRPADGVLGLIRPGDGPPLVARLSTQPVVAMAAVTLKPTRLMGYATEVIEAFGLRGQLDAWRPRLERVLGGPLEAAIVGLSGAFGVSLFRGENDQLGGLATVGFVESDTAKGVLERLMATRPFDTLSRRVGDRWRLEIPGLPTLHAGLLGANMVVSTDPAVFSTPPPPGISAAYSSRGPATLLASGGAGLWLYADLENLARSARWRPPPMASTLHLLGTLGLAGFPDTTGLSLRAVISPQRR